MGAAVLERKRFAHSVAVRIKYMRLIALLGLRQGELKRKRQIFAVRILSGCSKPVICRHGLSHLQARHATVGILHGRTRGKQMVELKRAQFSTGLGGIVYICWVIFLVQGHAVDARVGKDGRQLTVARATVLDIAQDRPGSLRRLVVAHVHQVVCQRGRRALGGARLTPRQIAAGVIGRAL